MPLRQMPLREVVNELERLYGPIAPPERDPWKAIVLENVAYLVDDVRRKATFDALADTIGIDPAEIRKATPKRLAAVIGGGGMKPEHRATKLHACADVAREVGLAKLRSLVRSGGPEARKLLKRFPGVGDPGADRLLMLAGCEVTLAPDSNALRALVRLGWGEPHADYARCYRSVAKAVRSELPTDREWLVAAHTLLRHHGRSLCLRTRPDCPACPLSGHCEGPQRDPPTPTYTK